MFVCPSCGASAPSAGFCTADGATLADAADDPLLGTSIGPYRLARTLGRGGMGAVYLGLHTAIGSRVAVKVLLPVAALSPGLVERFFAEARAVNVIRHESIVNILDQDLLPDGRPYIVMEYLDGQPLSAYFAKWQPFPLAVLVRLAVEVLSALAAAHAAGITHRDLKPDNIFVTSLGRAKVLDFGVAKLRPEQGGLSDGTRTGALLGTPHYMSPEQAMGQPVDPRSDLYSMGVILFQGATGRCPFDGTALYELLHQHLHVPPASPRAQRSDLPPQLESIILRALAKPREERFQSAREMAEALLNVLRELPEPDSHAPFGALLASELPHAGSPALTLTAPPAHAHAHTPPTMSALSNTLGERAPASPARGSPVGILLGATAVLVAVLALGIASIGVWVAWARGSAGSSPNPTPTTTTTRSRPVSGKAIDPIKYIPEATRRARAKLPDAELYQILVAGPTRDGFVDVDDMRKNLSYGFRSPAASAGNGSRKCLVSVTTNKNGIFDSVDASDSCNQVPLPPLRCSLAQIADRGSTTSEIATMAVQSSAGGAIWQVVYANGTFASVRDDC